MRMQCLAENSLVATFARNAMRCSLSLWRKATKTFAVSTESCAVASRIIATAVMVIGRLSVAFLRDWRSANTYAETTKSVKYIPI